MTLPHSPAAPPRWKRILHAALLALAGALGLVYGLLLAMGDAEPTQLTPMLLLFLAVALAIGALTHDLNIARSEARIKAHIDLRVSEVASRMERRMNAIANGMLEHGIKLDDITEEIPRLREHVQVVRAHVHSHVPALYQAGPDKMSVVGKASVLDPDVIDMAARLQRRVEPD